MRKGEIACNKQFFLFSQCFPPYLALISHFKCTLKYRLKFVSIWTSLKILLSGIGLRSGVVLEWWSLKAVNCLIQVVSNTGLTVLSNLQYHGEKDQEWLVNKFHLYTETNYHPFFSPWKLLSR